MPTFKIPNSSGQTRQANRGETSGELYSTFNIDLSSNKGKIKTSKRMKEVIDSGIDLDFNKPEDLIIFAEKYYLITQGGTFVCNISLDPTDVSNWSQETGITNSTTPNDTMSAVVFEGDLLISEDTDINSWDGFSETANWWTTATTPVDTALTDEVPHIMYSHKGGQETLFVTNGNEIRYYNSTAGHSTITLDSTLTTSCVAGGVSAVWVGTYSSTSDSAYVYEVYVGEQIDSAPVARNAYRVNARGVLAIEVINNVPYIFTETGEIQVFNGAGFVTVANFPFSWGDEYPSGVSVGNLATTGVSLPIHPNGTQAKQDSIFILLNSEKSGSDDTLGDRTPSGIWEFDTKTGVLNHFASFTESTGDKGHVLLEKSGPLMITDNEYTFALAGAFPVGSTKGSMFANDNTSSGFGYFTTKEIESDSVTDIFKELYLKTKTLSDGESASIKHREVKSDLIFADVTFADTNVVNTTDSITVSKGDEVTFLYGSHGGRIAHITDITTSATVTSIVLDIDIGIAGDTGRIVVENWKLIDDDYTSKDGEYKKIGVNQDSPWIQYKVVLDGDIELRQFLSHSTAKEKLG